MLRCYQRAEFRILKGQSCVADLEDHSLGKDALVTVCFWNTDGIMVCAQMLCQLQALGTRTEIWFGNECSGDRMLLEHERKYGLGMDALVTVCSWNSKGNTVWA